MLFQENNKAIYLQIADNVCDNVLSGTLPPGSRIPSVREYAADIEVNANTVMRAYDYLASRDIIYNKRGIGYFISPDAPQTVRQTRRDELLGSEINTLFNRLRLLGITSDELARLYNDYCHNNPITDK